MASPAAIEWQIPKLQNQCDLQINDDQWDEQEPASPMLSCRQVLSDSATLNLSLDIGVLCLCDAFTLDWLYSPRKLISVPPSVPVTFGATPHSNVFEFHARRALRSKRPAWLGTTPLHRPFALEADSLGCATSRLRLCSGEQCRVVRHWDLCILPSEPQ